MRMKPGRVPLIALGVIAVWAVAAVIMLTASLLSALSIEDTLVGIRKDVGEINIETDAVKLLDRTGELVVEIRGVATPLSPILGQVDEKVAHIDSTVTTILSSAESINTSAHTINDSAKAIGASVGSITANLVAIKPLVFEIGDSVNDIDRKFTTISGLAWVIDDGLVQANGTVDRVINRLRGIYDDLEAIKPIVDDINRNAEAIRNSFLVNLGLPDEVNKLLEGLLGGPLDALNDAITPAPVSDPAQGPLLPLETPLEAPAVPPVLPGVGADQPLEVPPLLGDDSPLGG